jgi:hypothetical protein
LRRRYKCIDYLEWGLEAILEWGLEAILEWGLEVILEWGLEVSLEWGSVVMEWGSAVILEWGLEVSLVGYRLFNENGFLKFVVQRRRFFFNGELPLFLKYRISNLIF